jgi:hypothetical protein
VVRFQILRSSLEEKLTEIANGLISITEPSKRLPFQAMRIPPEAPTEGAKMNLSNLFGAKFLMNEGSKLSFLVS